MDLPTKLECSWDCEGCIVCEPPIATIHNENDNENDNDNDKDNDNNNEEEAWENDDFQETLDKLTMEMKTKEEAKLFLETQAQKKELLEFHKEIRGIVNYTRTEFYKTYFMFMNCSKTHDLWTDPRFYSFIYKNCWKYYVKSVYYENNNYKKYLFCNKADCCCKKTLEIIKSKFIERNERNETIDIKKLREEISLI